MTRKYKKREPSPLHVGDIVMMDMKVAKRKKDRKWLLKNKNRLMRVTKLTRAMSENGWVVTVAVNENPIYDLDGEQTLELKGYDVGWFIKYDTK